FEDGTWALPELFPFAMDVLIEPVNVRQADPWSGSMHRAGHNPNGPITILERSFDFCKNDEALEQLAAAVRNALAPTRFWYGGEMILAQIYARQGRFEDARALIERRLADRRVHIPAEVKWLAGLELEKYPQTVDLAIRLYEGNIADLPN